VFLAPSLHVFVVFGSLFFTRLKKDKLLKQTCAQPFLLADHLQMWNGHVKLITGRWICKCRMILKHAAGQFHQLKIASAQACFAALEGDQEAADRQIVLRNSKVSSKRHIVNQLVASAFPLSFFIFVSMAEISAATTNV